MILAPKILPFLSIYQAGFRVKNIDVRMYKVKHGDWCPIPEGFTENQCLFVPVGYVTTEKYFESNYNYYKDRVPRGFERRDTFMISRDEYNRQKSRYLGKCSVYFLKNDNEQSNIGIEGTRRAVVEARGRTTSESENHDYYTDSYIYGELFVLVIAKQ